MRWKMIASLNGLSSPAIVAKQFSQFFAAGLVTERHSD
jgi:hypothetical protein